MTSPIPFSQREPIPWDQIPKSLRPRPKPYKPSVYDICPDGAWIVLPWGRWEVGDSVFVPALDLNKLRKDMVRVAALRGVRLRCYVRWESGYSGARFWRVL